MKIYTKTGDQGKTGLIGGTRVLKSDIRIESYGTVDELNSYIGWILSFEEIKPQYTLLREVQDRLFTIGSLLAADPEGVKMLLPDLFEEDIKMLETAIDKLSEEIPPMKHFVLPGGSQINGLIHVARCVCRRAERWVVALHQEHPVNPLILQYLNRLSDYLFVLARWVNCKYSIKEIPWLPRKQKK
ncbi:MAG: cob(I)yrinic acid a,c-diamide adenosyltransferase [Bacteroidia bacterium]|nr:cob(I)yrinic acid a,c-diamide adenosyltransferase [Bacteroidia bacterium]MDW8301800.1 cob(I)yrinic acid a,c-diamide adenosyltransferase [Bacteroidia bacterium]